VVTPTTFFSSMRALSEPSWSRWRERSSSQIDTPAWESVERGEGLEDMRGGLFLLR
jgi:hypothetical protein